MFSIIICSINPHKLARLETNIGDTIGCQYEILAYDNRSYKTPIAKVYNRGINNAKYQYIAFVHEDILFRTKGWGRILSNKLSEPNCGLIGFAGSKVKTDFPTGWDQGENFNVYHYYDGDILAQKNIDGDFSNVLILDGFALFASKAHCMEIPFDENLLTDFHCYDIDISICFGRHYSNFVCSAIDVVHYSSGKYNRNWVETTIKMYYMKWKKIGLPLTVDNVRLMKADTNKAADIFLFRSLRATDLPCTIQIKLYWSFCIETRHLGKCIQHGLKLFKNCVSIWLAHVFRLFC